MKIAMEKSIHIPDENALEQLCRQIATHCKAPLVIALRGDLGAGKTTFVRLLVHHLGGGKHIRVQSPTFAVARSYDTTPKVHHLDLYRVQDTASLEEMGLLQLIEDEQAIVCVEWPDAHQNILPPHTLHIDIKIEADDSRTLSVRGPKALLDFLH